MTIIEAIKKAREEGKRIKLNGRTLPKNFVMEIVDPKAKNSLMVPCSAYMILSEDWEVVQ